MKSIITFLFFLRVGTIALAQQDEIQPERPGETQNSETVARHSFQWEAGVKLEKITSEEHEFNLPESIFRFGVSGKFELRLEADRKVYHFQLIPNPKTISGFQPIELGCKAVLIEEKGVLPQTAIIAQIGIPSLASKEFKTEHAPAQVRLTFSNKLSEKITFGYNAGADWDGDNKDPKWLYTISPEMELGKNWNIFIEAYGFFQKNESAEHNLDAGLAYLVSNNIMLDISSGFGISHHSPLYFVSLGASIRFR